MCLGNDRTLCDRLACTVDTASWLVGFVGFCDRFVAGIERAPNVKAYVAGCMLLVA